MFNNLKYCLNQTFLYYNYLFLIEDFDSLPLDLEQKLYDLNDIDLIVENKNNQIKILAENKIIDFIHQTSKYLINNYINKFKEDVSIILTYDKYILDMINIALNNSIINFESDYFNILNKNLKELFLSSLSVLLQNQEKELKNINDAQKIIIRSQIKNISIIDSDDIINNINDKIIIYSNSIEEYQTKFINFRISEEFIQYINNFGYNFIKPMFKGISNIFNEFTKYKVIENIEMNSNNFENCFKLNNFLYFYNNLNLSLKNDYFKKIYNYLDEYGVKDYQKKLEMEMNRINQRSLGDSEITNNFSKNIGNKEINNNFHKIFEILKKFRTFIIDLKQFDEYNKTINKYYTYLNYSFNESMKIIIEKNYNEENNNTAFNKLNYIKEISLEYYNKISEKYDNLKQYLNQSIWDLEKTIDDCFNKTYNTLNDEYIQILKDYESVNSEYYKINEDLSPIYYDFTPDDKTYKIRTDIKNLQQYARFKFGVEFENNNTNIPKVIGNIINKSFPKTMIIDIYSEFGNCGKKGILLEAEFNNAEYSMKIDYNSNSTNINLTTLTNFEKYKYNIKSYQIIDSDETKCFTVAYIQFCIFPLKCQINSIINTENFINDKKDFEESIIIEN